MPLQQTKNLLDAHAQRILSGDAFDAENSMSASMFDLRMGVEESPHLTEAVQWQQKHLASRIDSLRRTNRTVRCLSLGCGHLLEAELSEAILQRNAMIFAVDPDPRNLCVVSKNYAHCDVDPICASPMDVLNGTVRFGHLDLAYAAGFPDSLSQVMATAFTAKLFSMLDTGGVVIVPSALKVRSRPEIFAFASEVPKSDIASQRYYQDPFGVIGYLELKKAR